MGNDSDNRERDALAPVAEALLLAMDGDFLPSAGMGVDNAGQDVPLDKARPKEVAWWAARTLAATNSPGWREVKTVPVDVSTLRFQCPTCGVPIDTVDGDFTTNGTDALVRVRPCGHDAVVTLSRFGT